MIRSAIVFGLAICFLTNFAAAQDEEKKKKKGNRQGGRNVAGRMMARFKNVDLSDEQKNKMKEIVKKFSGKLQEMRKEQSTLFTPEMRKARNEAGKKARAEGLKGKELQAALNKAAPVSEEVAGKLKALQQKMGGIQKELSQALTAVLTDEQKAKLPKRGQGNRGKKKNKKKEDADK